MKPPVEIWYGNRQSFGLNGLCQRWVNILGNVDTNVVESLRYSLNGSENKKLSIGPDGHRLAAKGDFNIELDSAELDKGENALVIEAMCFDHSTYSSNITVVFNHNRNAAASVNISWSNVKNINDVVQVVDGHWEITPQGLHIKQPYYDRVVGFGDISWQDYEVTAEVVFHGMRVPDKDAGDAGANVIHGAIALRWPGHDTDGLQPRVKWYPLGATAEFRVNPSWCDCSWRILGGADLCVESEQSCSIEPGKRYKLKHRVKTNSDGASVYSVRMWPVNESEPKNWQAEMIKDTGVQRGGILLIAHYADLTFGDVQVSAI